MQVMSTPSRQMSWRTGRQRVSVLAELALRKEVVSRRLTELREQHGLSQERAAQRVGVTMRQWQRWEGGQSVPYPRNLDAISEAFEISVAEFFHPEEAADGNGNGLGTPSQADRIEAKLDMILGAMGLALGESDAPAEFVEIFRDAAARAHAARQAEPAKQPQRRASR